MPAAEEKTTVFQEEILLLAEKLGDMSDRLAKVEGEFTAQTAPLDTAKAQQEAAFAALNAAIEGIRKLNEHVLSNDLGKVSVRVDELGRQAEAAIKAVEARLTELSAAREADKKEIVWRVAQSDAQRTELAQKRDEDAKAFEVKIGEVRQAVEWAQKTLAAEIANARKEFAAPASFNPRGPWSGAETYARLDVVTLNGTSYVSQVGDNREKPSKAAKGWAVLAARGSAAGGGGGSFSEPASLQPLAAGATITWDLINPVATVTLGAAANAFTFQNARAGGTYVLILKQDSNGSRTVTWPSNVKWPGNTAPTLTTTASRADVLYLTYDGTVYYGSLAQNFVTS
jgi:hypothetical protein